MPGRHDYDIHQRVRTSCAFPALRGKYRFQISRLPGGADRSTGLSSANIQMAVTRQLHANRLRSRWRCGKRVLMVQTAQHRFRDDERIRPQVMAEL